MKHSTTPPRLGYPSLGFGLGLRSAHYQHVLKEQPDIDWFEIISENYLDNFGHARRVLDQIAEQYPVVMHGVSMSIGSTDPLNIDYLKKLKTLSREIGAKWISDHLCWTGVLSKNTHDLMPLPLNEESLEHVIHRIKTVQDILEQPLVIENPSTYLSFKTDTLTEWEYLTYMSEEADCGLLLDVNNIFVSSVNHNFDPEQYLEHIPHHRVVQMHLAGHTNYGTHIIDTHDHPVVEQVWQLYKKAQEYCPNVSTLLEWDSLIPPFPELEKELQKAKDFVAEIYTSKNLCHTI